jgi:hypothetical protein
LVGSALLILGGLLAALTADQEQFRAREGLLTAGLLFTLAGYAAIHLTHRERYGRLGATSAAAAALGQALIMVSGAGTTAAGSEESGGALAALFLTGFVAFILGVIGLAVGIYRARLHPRWSALLLPAGSF